MSDSTAFRLMLLQPENVNKYIECEDKNNPSGDTLIKKGIYGSTRNGWFVGASRELIAAAGLSDAIKFLSNERRTVSRITGGREVNYTVTGECQAVPSDEWKLGNEGHMGGYLREYTIILQEEIAEIARQLERLSDFCKVHIDSHPILADYLFYRTAQELLTSLEHFNFQDVKFIDDCPGGDEGDTGDYYFFALHAIKIMIAEAVGKDLAAIYVNESSVSVNKAA